MTEVVAEKEISPDQRIQLVHGDLTEETTDAIVNAANEQLSHGGGVAAAILRKGGEQIAQESRAWVREHGPVSHDRPAITSAGRLSCRYVLHAVGPRWGEGQEREKLERAVRGALETGQELSLESLSLPAISTGIFGFPADQAAQIILEAVQDHLAHHPEGSLSKVRITIIDQPTLEIFQQAFEGGEAAMRG